MWLTDFQTEPPHSSQQPCNQKDTPLKSKAKTLDFLSEYKYSEVTLVRFARCCTSVFYFLSKYLQITSKLLKQGYRYIFITSFGKRLESSLDHTLNFCPNLVQYRVKNMYLKEVLTRSSTVILSTN